MALGAAALPIIGAGVGATASALPTMVPSLAGVAGPLMESGSFFSQPLAATMEAAGSGASTGFKYGSLAQSLMGGMGQPEVPPQLPQAAGTNASRMTHSNPMSQYAASTLLDKIPADIRSQLFPMYGV